jgi:hypothetical protein
VRRQPRTSHAGAGPFVAVRCSQGPVLSSCAASSRLRRAGVCFPWLNPAQTLERLILAGPYIAVIVCSARVLEKINSKHGVSIDEVRDAFQWPATPTRASWVLDHRGRRLAVEGFAARGRVVRAVLYPVDVAQGTWRLGTAVPMV